MINLPGGELGIAPGGAESRLDFGRAAGKPWAIWGGRLFLHYRSFMSFREQSYNSLENSFSSKSKMESNEISFA